MAVYKTEASIIKRAEQIGAFWDRPFATNRENASDELVVYIEIGPVDCRCGCGLPAADNSHFRQGHDMKLVSKLMFAHDLGATIQITEGGAAKSCDPITAADHFGGAFPAKMAQRIMTDQLREQKKAEKAAKKAALKATTGQAVAKPEAAQEADEAAAQEFQPRAITAKVGRWTYEGYLDSDGSFYYTNKADKTITVAPGKFTEV